MKKHGITLIELIVVVMIVSVLAAVAVPRYSAAVDRAKWSEANASAGSIRSAVRAYVTESGLTEAQKLVGTKLDNATTQEALGYGSADLEGTFFSQSDYTITAIDSAGSAEVTITGGSKSNAPAGSYVLESDGDWLKQ